MNHPKREDWVLYLYKEAEPQARAQMRQHLTECQECRAQVGEWKQSLRFLDNWKTPMPPRRAESFQPVLRWGLAFACLALLAAGFFAGRLSFGFKAARQDQAQLIENAKQELRAEFAQVLHEELSKTAAATLTASGEQAQGMLVDYNQTVEARLQAEKEQRQAACLALKRDVDTLAINADVGLQNTEQRLAQLVGLRVAQNTPTQSH